MHSGKLLIEVCEIARKSEDVTDDFNTFYYKNEDALVNLFLESENPITFLIKNGECQAAFRLIFYTQHSEELSETRLSRLVNLDKIYFDCLTAEMQSNNPLLTLIFIYNTDINFHNLYHPDTYINYENLSNALAVNTHLEQLYLHSVDKNYFKAMMNSLERNTSIKHLVLFPGIFQLMVEGLLSNDLDATHDQRQFERMLAQNTNLIYLSGNGVILSGTIKPPEEFIRAANLFNAYIIRNHLLQVYPALSCAWKIFSLHDRALGTDSLLAKLLVEIRDLIISFIMNDFKKLDSVLPVDTISFWQPCAPVQHEMHISNRARNQFSAIIYDIKFNDLNGLYFECLHPISELFTDFLKATGSAEISDLNDFGVYTIKIKTPENMRRFFSGLKINESTINEIHEHFGIKIKEQEQKISFQNI